MSGASERTNKRISEWPNTSQFLVILNHSATVGGTGPIWRCLDGEKDIVVVVVVAIADVVVDVVVVVAHVVVIAHVVVVADVVAVVIVVVIINISILSTLFAI